MSSDGRGAAGADERTKAEQRHHAFPLPQHCTPNSPSFSLVNCQRETCRAATKLRRQPGRSPFHYARHGSATMAIPATPSGPRFCGIHAAIFCVYRHADQASPSMNALMVVRRRSSLFLAAPIIGSIALLLAGCGIQDASLADRCADLMERAFPGGGIDVTDEQTQTEGTRTIIARVQGVRRKVPAGGVTRREVAVACEYEDSILTGFHWTAGPLR